MLRRSSQLRRRFTTPSAPAEQSSFLRTAPRHRPMAPPAQPPPPTRCASGCGALRPVRQLFDDCHLGRRRRADGARPCVLACARISRSLRARQFVERIVDGRSDRRSAVAILTTIGIVLSLIFESYPLLQKVPVLDFLFGTALVPAERLRGRRREAPVDNSDVFGAVPLFAGTLLITAHRHAGRRADRADVGDLPVRVRRPAASAPWSSRCSKSSPASRPWSTASSPRSPSRPSSAASASLIGLGVSSESALAAGIVMGIMIIPFVSSLSDDVINAVPQIAARRLGRPWRDQVGDHPQGHPARGAARHRRRPSCSRSAAPSARP